MKTRVGPATKHLLAMTLKEANKPGEGRIAKAFVTIFKDEIMRHSIFEKLRQKPKQISREVGKNARKSACHNARVDG